MIMYNYLPVAIMFHPRYLMSYYLSSYHITNEDIDFFYINIHIFVYIYVYIYIHIFVYICIYIYIYTCVCVRNLAHDMYYIIIIHIYPLHDPYCVYKNTLSHLLHYLDIIYIYPITYIYHYHII